MQELNALEEKIGYKFKRREMLEEALTHTSYANSRNISSYERLEFLGDAVLNFLVATHIFRLNEKKDEAFLTDLKSGYVNRKFLQQVGERCGLQKFIKAEGLTEYRLDQATEAVIGAIFLDGGYQAARKFVNRFILSHRIEPLADFKTMLMTHAREKFNKKVHYTVERESGPAHRRIFQIKVKVEGKNHMSRARGHSKKEAEMEASRTLLKKLQSPDQGRGQGRRRRKPRPAVPATAKTTTPSVSEHNTAP